MSGLDTRAIDAQDLAEAPAPDVQQGFRVFVAEAAFDQATAHGGEDTTREVGGILVGDVYRDDAGPYVLVKTTLEARHAEEKGTELTFTHATWDHFHKEMDEHHGDSRIVGWYHTHPGFGIFLSDRDQFIHRSFFNLPYQIALVYDPKSREHGVFAWRDNEPARCQRYWLGRTEHVWHAPSPQEQTKMETNAEERPATASAPSAGPQPDLDRMSLLTGALVLIMLGGLLGWWLGRGTSRAVVRDAETQLQQQRAAGAQEMLKGLHTELLLMVRRSLSGDSVKVPMDGILEGLDTGLAALEKNPADASAVAGLREQQRKLRELRDSLLKADLTLRRLAEASRAGTLDPAALARSLSLHAAALGQTAVELAELAARDKDPVRAKRLLTLAMRVDPNKRELYARKLAELEKKR